MTDNEIYQFDGKNISRYEWNRLNENLNGRFTVFQQLDKGIMHTVLRQEAQIINTRLVPIAKPMKFKISIFVRWYDLYKRKLLLINRTK